MKYKTKNHFLLSLMSQCVNYDEGSDFETDEMMDWKAIEKFYGVKNPFRNDDDDDDDDDEAQKLHDETIANVWNEVNELLQKLIDAEK